MLVMDLLFWYAFGPGSPHIVLPLHLQHLAANIPGQDRNATGRTKDRGQQQVPDPVHDHTKPGRVSDSESFQPDHRYVEVGYYKDD